MKLIFQFNQDNIEKFPFAYTHNHIEIDDFKFERVKEYNLILKNNEGKERIVILPNMLLMKCFKDNECIETYALSTSLFGRKDYFKKPKYNTRYQYFKLKPDTYFGDFLDFKVLVEKSDYEEALKTLHN